MYILPGARKWMRSHGVSDAQVQAVLTKPARRIAASDDPAKTLLFGNGLCIVVGRTGDIIAVSPSLVGVQRDKVIGRRSKGGRGGNDWPTSWSVMRRRILGCGLVITEDGPHHKVRHPGSGRILGLMPSGNRPSRKGYSGIVDLGKALLAAGFDTRNTKT